MVHEKIGQAGIAEIRIERMGKEARVWIRASRPGLIIGRGGKGIEELKNALVAEMRKIRRRKEIKDPFLLHVNVEEIKRTEIFAAVVAQEIAKDIARRLPYRRVMKRHLEVIKQVRGVEGAKIRL